MLTWHRVNVFGFIGNPKEYIFLKPRETQIAAERYMFDFRNISTPNWETYHSLLKFANLIKKDSRALSSVDNIDLQYFIWVMGSEEYPERKA